MIYYKLQNMFSLKLLTLQNLVSYKLKFTTYKTISLANIRVTCFLGNLCTPFGLNTTNNLVVLRSNSIFFLFVSYLHYLTSIYGLYDNSQSVRFTILSLQPDGSLLGVLLMNIYITFVSTTVLIFLKRKTPTFVNLVNFLNNYNELNLGLGTFQTNLVKVIVIQPLLITIPCSILILVVLLSNIEFHTANNWSQVTWNLVFNLYRWWDWTWVVQLDLLVGFCGLFVAYAAVYLGSRSVFKEARNGYQTLSWEHYQKLQIVTRLVNECFQDEYAIGIMASLMCWAVLATSVILSPNMRSILPGEFILVFVLLLFEIYAFFVIGYTFPGKALCASRATKNHWKMFVDFRQNGANEQYQKRKVRACADIKLRFGSVNYYGRMTALAVVQFVIEKSLKVMLLMK